MPNRRATRRAVREQELHESINLGSEPATPNEQALPTTTMDELIRNLRGPSNRKIKAPTYDGNTDVEMFITDFTDVADMNQWDQRETQLHLRLSLTNKAKECARTEGVYGIFQELRTRFGLTTKQARDQLRITRKQPGQSLHELGSEISRLLTLAYPALSPADRMEMSMDAFSKAIENVALQRHLLATQPITLTEMIQSADEFLQIGRERTKITVTNTDEETPASNQMKQLTIIIQSIQEQQQTIQQQIQSQQGEMIKIMEQLANRQNIHPPDYRGPNRYTRRPLACYGCGGPHPQRLCPQNKQSQQSGNLDGPVQP